MRFNSVLFALFFGFSASAGAVEVQERSNTFVIAEKVYFKNVPLSAMIGDVGVASKRSGRIGYALQERLDVEFETFARTIVWSDGNKVSGDFKVNLDTLEAMKAALDGEAEIAGGVGHDRETSAGLIVLDVEPVKFRIYLQKLYESDPVRYGYFEDPKFRFLTSVVSVSSFSQDVAKKTTGVGSLSVKIENLIDGQVEVSGVEDASSKVILEKGSAIAVRMQMLCWDDDQIVGHQIHRPNTLGWGRHLLRCKNK